MYSKSKVFMANRPYILGLFSDPLQKNLPFGICAIYFDLKAKP